MKIQQLLDRLANLDVARRPEDMVIPSPELIALYLRMVRRFMNLKKEALASMAGISLSTLERVENAESVSAGSLDKIAVALGEEPGYFTAPSKVQSTDQLGEKIDGLQPISVGHVTTQPHVRELARCQSFLINAPGCDHLGSEINGLVEWLDLASSIVGPHAHLLPDLDGLEHVPRRDLYRQILGAVEDLEKQGVTVLGGVLQHPQHGVSDWKIAIINITRKDQDPAASKRKFVFVDMLDPAPQVYH